MPELIEQPREARQRALSGFDSKPDPEPVGVYAPTRVHFAGVIQAWTDGSETVWLHAARTPTGREFEVFVVTNVMETIATAEEESEARRAAEQYMR